MSNDRLKQFFSDTWWMVLVRGLAILALGILFLVRPLSTIMVLLTFLGGYWLIDGIITIVRSIRTRKYIGWWGWELFAGILGILSGAILVLFPLFSAMMTMIFAITLVSTLTLLNGVTSIVKGISLRKEITNEWSMILGGVLMTVLAILAFLFPRVAQAVIVWTVGLAAVAGGIWTLVLSLRMRRAGKSSEASPTAESE